MHTPTGAATRVNEMLRAGNSRSLVQARGRLARLDYLSRSRHVLASNYHFSTRFHCSVTIGKHQEKWLEPTLSATDM
jgi:hypothetical protein